MKKILIYTGLAMLLFACKKEAPLVKVKSNAGAAVISSPTDGTAIVVTPADSSQLLSVKWSKADYGVQTVVTYTLEIGADASFANSYNLGSTTVDSLSLTVGGLNNALLNKLNLPANAASAVQIRIISTLNGKDSLISKPVKLNVTTYKEVAPLTLWVPGAYQGWSPGTAPVIYLLGNNQYEGYVYMNTGDYYKFTSAPDWNHVNYGDGGNGGLTIDGLAGGLKANAAGYYKFNVDTKNLTYTASLIASFGVIGSATPGGWNSSTPMTFDPVHGTWSVTLNLISGALKIRANDDWGINYGPADSNALTGSWIFNDPGAITIPADGNYTVTIDMGQSSQKKYLYTVVKN